MRIGNYEFDQVLAIAIGQKLLLAALVLLVTWLLARAAKWACAQLVDKVEFFRRSTSSGESIGVSLGKIVSLLIWLFGLLALLQVFNLAGVMAPVQTLLNNVMGFLPKLIGAGLIFFKYPKKDEELKMLGEYHAQDMAGMVAEAAPTTAKAAK